MIELLILIVLWDETCSIYRIKQKIEEQFSIFLKVSFGSIHPAIKKMEKENYLTVKSKVSPGGQRKSSYTITLKGKNYFEELMNEDLSNNPSITNQQINIKLIGLSKLHVDLHKPIVKSMLIFFEKQKISITHNINKYSDENEKFYRHLMKYQIKKVSDDIQWISSFIPK